MITGQVQLALKLAFEGLADRRTWGSVTWDQDYDGR